MQAIDSVHDLAVFTHPNLAFDLVTRHYIVHSDWFIHVFQAQLMGWLAETNNVALCKV